jgi:Aminoglycoside-2''-adenylyltransferase
VERRGEDRSSDQLSTLARIAEVFERADVEYWLFGGWAVDFYAARVTRNHDDVDLAIWLDDLPRVTALLEGEGWSHAPEPDEDGGTGYEHSDVRLELTYLVREGGGVYLPLRSGRAVWPSDALGTDTAELRGVSVRIVSLESLARAKGQARADPEDAAKDVADARVLAEVTRD